MRLLGADGAGGREGHEHHVDDDARGRDGDALGRRVHPVPRGRVGAAGAVATPTPAPVSDTPPRFVVRARFALARDALPVRARFVVARRPLASVDDEHQVDAVLPVDAAELAPVDAPVVDADEHDVDAPRAVPPVDA